MGGDRLLFAGDDYQQIQQLLGREAPHRSNGPAPGVIVQPKTDHDVPSGQRGRALVAEGIAQGHPARRRVQLGALLRAHRVRAPEGQVGRGIEDDVRGERREEVRLL